MWVGQSRGGLLGRREYDFPDNGRAPVGLNPERIIAACKDCGQWLFGCEFHVEYCDHCMESKPAAVDD